MQGLDHHTSLDHHANESWADLFVQLEPGDVVFSVLELEAKVPGLTQPDSAAHQVKQLLTRRLDRENPELYTG